MKKGRGTTLAVEKDAQSCDHIIIETMVICDTLGAIGVSGGYFAVVVVISTSSGAVFRTLP